MVFTSLQLSGNLSMTAENSNSSPMQMELFPKKQELFDYTTVADENMWPFLLRILRPGSKSDIYFGSKI